MLNKQADELSFHVFNSLEDYELLKAWNFLEEFGICTQFQGLNYTKSIIRSFVDDKLTKPYFLMVCDKESREPIVIIPLVLRHNRGLVWLEFIDFYVSDLQFPIFNSAYFTQTTPIEFNQKIMAGLQNLLPAHDILFSRRWLVNFDGHENPLIGFFGDLGEPDKSFFLNLDPENMKQSGKKTSVYKSTRRKRRKLENELGIEIKTLVNHNEVKSAFDSMQHFRKSQFKDSPGTDSFNNPQTGAFFKDLVTSNNSDRTDLCTAMMLNNRMIGFSFASVRGDKMTGQVFSIDDGPWKKHSPGLVTMLHEIDCAINMGLKVYDFGAGSDPYKQRFTNQSRISHRAVKANSLRGGIYILLQRLKRIWGYLRFKRSKSL